MSESGRDPEGPIVVGVDGSESSKRALRWAADQATMTHARLRVVTTWELPTAAYMAPLPQGLDLEGDARKMLEATIDEVLGSDAATAEPVVAEGHPAPALVAESRQASLLVVGSRGHGAFTGMLLGSVSEHCVTHADCPVVVVRGRRGEQRPS